MGHLDDLTRAQLTDRLAERFAPVTREEIARLVEHELAAVAPAASSAEVGRRVEGAVARVLAPIAEPVALAS